MTSIPQIIHRIVSPKQNGIDAGLQGGGATDPVSSIGGLISQAQSLSIAGVGRPGLTSIGISISSVASTITGAGSGAAAQIAAAAAQMTTATMSGIASLLTQMQTQFSSLLSAVNPTGMMAQEIHKHVINLANGVLTSAFQGQHTTTWDQDGVTHTSSRKVTSTAPIIPHNGNILGSDNFVLSNVMTALNFSTTSDARLKSNIKDYAPPLERLMRVKVKTFDKRRVAIDDDGRASIHAADPEPSLGAIAQEMESIFPELVGEANGFKTVEEGKVAFVTLAALQQFVRETRAEIADLKKQLAAR